MTKGKVTLGDYEMNGFVFIGMMLILIFCSVILGVIMTKDNNLNINISIPDTKIINAFCRSNSYEYGWLSSTSCGINEVQCFKQVGDARYYDCLKFISVKP